MTESVWTEDRVDHLKKLWEAGLSASQISGELACGLSRNAVIGKIHRMGLSGRIKSPSSTAPVQRKARPAKQYRVRGTNLRSAAAEMGSAALAEAFEADTDPEVLAYDNVIPMTQRVDLLGLNADTCRWPIGDPQSPDFAFCGGRPLAGAPYCAGHSRLAYMPSSDRRRQPSKPMR